MKVNEAVEVIKNMPMGRENDTNGKLSDLFYNECISRTELRTHGKQPTMNLIEGVIKEVTEWFGKVVDGCGVERIKVMHIPEHQQNTVYAKYKMMNPRATKEVKKMRLAYQLGIHPLEVLTKDGLEAIGDSMLGNISASFRVYELNNDKRKAYAESIKRTYCPLNEMARDCENQETFLMNKEKMPTVEDCVFVCKLDKCPKGVKQ
jgi:hypothetical protein